MRTRFKAIVTLLLVAPALTEIVSGNTPPHALLHPTIDAFLIAVYSLPILLIRELSVRWRLRTLGVFLLGLAYGLLNEGLVAQTLIRYQHVPIANFDRYVCAAGINFSWAALILPWHALMAVTFPLALLGLWFPSCAQSRWLGDKTLAALAAVIAGAVAFLGLVRTPHFQMRASLFAMAALVASAWFSRGTAGLSKLQTIRRSHSFALGAVFYVALYLGATILAGRKVPAGLYFSFVALALLGFGWAGRRFEFERLPDAGLVSLGGYFAASLFSCLGGFMKHVPEAVVCGSVLSVLFLLLWRSPWRVELAAPPPEPQSQS